MSPDEAWMIVATVVAVICLVGGITLGYLLGRDLTGYRKDLSSYCKDREAWRREAMLEAEISRLSALEAAGSEPEFRPYQPPVASPQQ